MSSIATAELEALVAEYKAKVIMLQEAYDEDWPNGTESLRRWLLGPMADFVMEITFWDHDVWAAMLKEMDGGPT